MDLGTTYDNYKKLSNIYNELFDIENNKTNQIKEIKNNYNVTDFFNAKINNYKVMASIYNLIENKSFSPNLIIKSKTTLLEHIIEISKQKSKNKSHQCKPEDTRLQNIVSHSDTKTLHDFIIYMRRKLRSENKYRFQKEFIIKIQNGQLSDGAGGFCKETLNFMIERLPAE